MRLHKIAIFLCLCCSAAVAQDVLPPATTTRVEPKEKSLRIWTNEDIQSLRGGVNVIGSNQPAPDEPKREAATEKALSSCESDAWVATVSEVLKLQGVPYPKSFWSDRLFGGGCVDHVALSAVAGRIAGEYTLDDGRKLRLKTHPGTGLPAASQIVASMDHEPLIVKWKDQPLVITKVDYIDRQYDYVSQYSISSLMLTNVLTGRRLIFDIGAHSASEIEGSFQIVVEKR